MASFGKLLLIISLVPTGGAVETKNHGPWTRGTRVIVGEPFIAQFEELRSAEGEAATGVVNSGWLFRDSRGRERYEISVVDGGKLTVVLIGIADTVDRKMYSLSPPSRTAVVKSAAFGSSQDGPEWLFPGRPLLDKAEVTMLENISCQFIPIAGEFGDALQGKVWLSSEMGQVIREELREEKVVTTWHLFNIKRSEPSADLFRVPKDYVLIDAP